jgi:hypothetical protein
VSTRKSENAICEGTTGGLVGCAVCTVSYLPRARVAAESWRQHHPEASFFVLVIDGADLSYDDEKFEIVLPENLGLPPDELALQRGIYDAYELSCALKPHFFRWLLTRGASAVIFTDSDACFYARLDELGQSAASAGLALIPYLAGPPALARHYLPITQSEYRAAHAGLFNTGLLAVGQSGRGFLDWWADWLARDCLKEPAAGMWTDETWCDWAAVYFEHVIVRDTALNVAFWNLDERVLGGTENQPTIDGAPLRHFHFAAFDPQRPDTLSSYAADIAGFVGRALPTAPPNPVLARLTQRYAERLLDCGSEELRERAYDYGISASGRLLGRRERAVYREAVLAAESRGADPPPNPFDSSCAEQFERLVDEPASLRTLSLQAQRRLGRLRPSGLSLSSVARVAKRVVPAAGYALTERRPAGLDVHARIPSDIVRLEY